ncbi:MAG: TMEM165/GDT1 family protein [bacterium]
MIQALLASFALVFASEMGDKTQLLAFSLATRFRKPGAVLGGIAAATVVLNLLATTLGVWIGTHVDRRTLSLGVAVTFIGFGLWTLLGEEEEDESAAPSSSRGAFWTSATLFFVAELGDKTQLAAIGLAAKYDSIAAVTAGATLAMVVADGLAVLLGERLAERLPKRAIRRGAAALFFLFGALAALDFFVQRG